MSERFRYDFTFSNLDIDTDRIGKFLDYDKDSNTAFVAEMIEDALNQSASLCRVRAEFTLYDMVTFEKPSSMVINGVLLDVGKIVAGQLRKSDIVAVFACSAGQEIGDEARKLIGEKDFLKGYILDLIGSQAADGAADLMQEELRIVAERRGLKITNRYSPGYCGWNVSEQHKLFSLMPDNYCGITLNPSALMHPIKSVSGIIGLGRNVRFNQYTCNLCDQENCLYRDYKTSAGK